jgi:PKD repeat protein
MKKIYSFFLFSILFKKNQKSRMSFISVFLTMMLGCSLQGFSLDAPAGPLITVGSLTGFNSQCINTASDIQSYTVSGSFLTSPVVVTPPVGFEISVSGGSFFSASSLINLHPQPDGSIEDRIIYVRFIPASAQAYSANITHTSTGAVTQNVAVTGTGITAPVADFSGSLTTINAGSNVTFNDISTNTPTSWSWSFPGGTPSSSTSQNPLVTYGTAGTYSISLTTTNSCGSDEETKPEYITVTSPCITPEALVPAVGDGTIGNPYRIASLENLYWIVANRSEWSKYFIQTGNIDASATADWCTGGWLPIGNWYVNESDKKGVFSGSYDGQGNTISGLHIKDSPSYVAFGLFGATRSAKIKNLGIIDVVIDISIPGNTPTGALAGLSAGSLIENCYSTGNVQNLSSGNSGGLVGEGSESSSVINSYSSCNVTGTHNTGGLVGINSNSSITNCYYLSGIVNGSGSDYSVSGGLVGMNYYNSIISKCYSSGTVTGFDNAGGLAGVNAATSQIFNSYSRCRVSSIPELGYMSGGFIGDNDATSTIINCYSTGFVSGNVRGFLGNSGGGAIENCFWDTETSTAIKNEGGTGKTTTEMKTQSTFTGWDFSTIWGMDGATNDGYPYLAPASSCSDGTIALTSGTADQTVCVISVLTPVVYTIGGGATGASLTTALPEGLSGVYNSETKTFTISGIPLQSGIIEYTVSTTGTKSPCEEMTASGTITVKALPFATFDTPPSNSPVCSGGDASFYITATPGSRISYHIGGYLGDDLSDIDASGKTRITVSNVTDNITVTLLSVQYSDGLCPVSINESITVVVNPLPALPSANDQSFCSSKINLVGDLIATGENVAIIKWYNVAEGGSPLAATDELLSGTYYVSQTVGSCESERKAINVTLFTTGAPSGKAIQTFCSYENHTIEELVAEGENILWYANSTGGEPLPANTVLVNGTHYYASQTAEECESINRLDVLVSLSATAEIIFHEDGTFTVPGGITEITVKAWGGGGGASGSNYTNPVYVGGSGGGGGGFCGGTLIVSPGEVISITVGQGGSGGGDYGGMGSNSKLTGAQGIITAYGGWPGQLYSKGGPGKGGSFTGAVVNGVIYNGGDGSISATYSQEIIKEGGGGGGGGAGDSQNGGHANYLNGGGGGTASGGKGGNGSRTASGDSGLTYGGGGGGGSYIAGSKGGNGANGAVIITYPCGVNCSDGILTLTTGNNDQTICCHGLMDDVIYTVGGSATGAEVTGLPSGVTGNFNNGTFTISGTPTVAGSFSYSVKTTGTSMPCSEATSGGTITVNPLPDVMSGSATISLGETTSLSPATGGTWTSSNPAVATVTDAGIVTGVSAGTATFTFTDATTGCNATTGEITVLGCISPVASTPLGNGTIDNPYQIATLENLYWISVNPLSWANYFIQTADIDASAAADWCKGGWLPIGIDYDNAFSGNYDGKGHSISGLYITNSSAVYYGLFGYAKNAAFQNLGITDVHLNLEGETNSSGALLGYAEGYVSVNNCYSTGVVKGNKNTGGLVGCIVKYSILENSYSTCDVSGSVDIGGLVGSSYNLSEIINCFHTTGIVSSTSYSAGGLVGLNSGSLISKCYSTGKVMGQYHIGGLVGWNDNASIRDCFSRCTILNTSSSDPNFGGLVGVNNDNSIINNCYSAGSVQAGMGGLVGVQDNAATTTSSFWDTETSGTTISAGGAGKFTSDMKSQSTFTDWDFTSIWGMNVDINDGYPYLVPEILRLPLVTIISDQTWRSMCQSECDFHRHTLQSGRRGYYLRLET